MKLNENEDNLLGDDEAEKLAMALTAVTCKGKRDVTKIRNWRAALAFEIELLRQNTNWN